jgi:hypothetical protein
VTGYENDRAELRLFLEDLCCELCRLHHVANDGLSPEDIHISREVRLAPRGAFADIVVTLPGQPAYFVDVKYGLSIDETVRRIRAKYAINQGAMCDRLVVVVSDLDAAKLQSRLRDCVCPTLDIEIWDEAWLLSNIKLRYGVEIHSLVEADIIGLHRSIQLGVWNQIFDQDFALASALLWHFSPWTLKRLHEKNRLNASDIWSVGEYLDVAIVMADICSFSAYVRDTKDDRVTNQVLTAFYSQTRYAAWLSNGRTELRQGIARHRRLDLGALAAPDRQSPGKARRPYRRCDRRAEPTTAAAVCALAFRLHRRCAEHLGAADGGGGIRRDCRQ